MSYRTLLLEIINALEEQGLNRNECQLQWVIDLKALERLVDPAITHTDLEFGFRLVRSAWE